MANVDLTTKKITGAKKGTKTFYHELGHIKFEKECKWGNTVRVIQDQSFKTLIFSTALTVLEPVLILKAIVVLCLLANIFSEIFEERWCWNYARDKLLGKKNRDAWIKTIKK